MSGPQQKSDHFPMITHSLWNLALLSLRRYLEVHFGVARTPPDLEVQKRGQEENLNSWIEKVLSPELMNIENSDLK
jgi:hypothetical protein